MTCAAIVRAYCMAISWLEFGFAFALPFASVLALLIVATEAPFCVFDRFVMSFSEDASSFEISTSPVAFRFALDAGVGREGDCDVKAIGCGRGMLGSGSVGERCKASRRFAHASSHSGRREQQYKQQV